MKLRRLALCLVALWSRCAVLVTASAVPPNLKSGSIPNPLLDAASTGASIIRNATIAGMDRVLDSHSSTSAASTTKPAQESLTDAWWPLWWGKESKKNATVTTTEADASKKTKKPKSSKSEREEKKNGKKDQKTNTTDVKEESKKHKKREEKKTEETPESQNTTDTKSDSQTANTTVSPTQPQPQPQPQPQQHQSPPQQRTNTIVVGQPPPGMHRYRPPISPQQEQQQQHMRNMATSVALYEASAYLLSSIVKYGFFVWATMYFRNRIETIPPTQHFVFERLNDRFLRDTVALQTALSQPPTGISLHRWNRVMSRRRRQSNISDIFQRPSLEDVFKTTVIVVEYGNNDLDLKYLADLVSFLITQHQDHAFGSVPYQQEGVDTKTGKKKTVTYFKPVTLEVVFKIDSPGGSVTTFGLAAAQVNRLRQAEGITTTVCVDKYAASGGYMIASQANKLLAAPFATVGSVGVIVATLNFHDILKQYGIQPVVLKAGEHKVPITQFGPITKQDLEKEQEMMDKVHKEFQKYTILGRPQLKGKELEVCNGSTYMGQEAVDVHLVDGIITSDAYIMQKIQAGDRVLKIHRSHQSRLSPHLLRLSPSDLFPNVAKRIQAWLSGPDMAARLVQAGSLLGFLRHLLLKHISDNPAGF